MKKSFLVSLSLLVVMLVAGRPLDASDHADPMTATELNSGITGLFVFSSTAPDGSEQMNVIMTIRRALTADPPYDVEPYEYRVHMDLRGSSPTYADEEARKRYGGSVADPTAISAEASIIYRLTSEAKFQEGYPRLEGELEGKSFTNRAAGVYDDPFIFPRFFKKNVIAMAVQIPMSAFAPGQRDWIIWGTTHRAKNDKQIDHVGRSNRTQLGRLDFLNTIEPRDQLAAIEQKIASGNKVGQAISHVMGHFLPVGAVGGLFDYVLRVREYDAAPDVMFFTTRTVVPGTEADPEPTPIPVGFPNGRRLTDDVAALTCATGDCVLQEFSFIEGHWPRATENDKPFKADFPYLADPWKVDEMEAAKQPFHWDVLIFWLIVAALVLWFFLRWRKKQLEKMEPYVR